MKKNYKGKYIVIPGIERKILATEFENKTLLFTELVMSVFKPSLWKTTLTMKYYEDVKSVLGSYPSYIDDDNYIKYHPLTKDIYANYLIDLYALANACIRTGTKAEDSETLTNCISKLTLVL